MKNIVTILLSILFSITELFSQSVDTNFVVIELQSGKRQFLNTILAQNNTIINFWSIHCPPCEKEIPELLKLQRKYGNFQFVFLNVNKSSDKKAVFDLAKELGIEHLTYLDSYQKVLLEFTKDNAIPVTLIWDKQKGIIFQSEGYNEEKTISSLEANLNKLFKQKNKLHKL